VRIPPGDRRASAAGNPKQFWKLLSGGHIAAHKVARSEYERRVREFFAQNLF